MIKRTTNLSEYCVPVFWTFWLNLSPVDDFKGIFNSAMQTALSAITAKTAYNIWRFVIMM